MPTYEYRCADCGHHFDIVQSFSDDSLTVCPECGGHLKKVFGNVGISFKGSGFYVNDSGSNKHPTPRSSESSGSESSSGASSSGSSDGSSSTSSKDSASSTTSGGKTSSDTAKSA